MSRRPPIPRAIPGAILAAAAVTAAFAPQERPPGPEQMPPEQIGDNDSELVAGYREAATESEKPIDQYNLGTALLMDGRWLEAREPLQAAGTDEKETVRSYGVYNYGMASALAGHEGDEEAETRRGELMAARQSFRHILREDPTDEDARWNLELVDRWLEEEEEESGGQGSAGGDADSQSGGGSQGAPQAGQQGQDRRPISPEDAAALLDSAGRAESSIRDRMLGRTRYRDPVVEKNW